jgi:hypothetical protein
MSIHDVPAYRLPPTRAAIQEKPMIAQYGANRWLVFYPLWLRALIAVIVVQAGLRPCLAQHSQPDGSTAKSQPQAASPDKLIEKALSDLGSRNYLVRANASRRLWKAGAKAQAALEKAVTESDDLEVVSRARQIVTLFRLGVYPDSPRELVEQISNFRSGNYATKQRIAQELISAGKAELVRRLIELVPSARMRARLSRMVPLASGIEGPNLPAHGAA